METCKHSDEGLCWACAANRKAAYDLTGTHDPEEQKQYWDGVSKEIRKIRREKFKRKLQGK